MNRMLLALVLLAGVAMPIESAINARLRDSVASPALSALSSFVAGTLVMLCLTVSGVMGKVNWNGAGHAPWWQWTGGVLGAGIVTVALIALPKTGAASFIVWTVLGEVAAGLAMDHFGVLGVPRVPLNGSRVAGALLVCAGVFLTTRK